MTKENKYSDIALNPGEVSDYDTIDITSEPTGGLVVRSKQTQISKQETINYRSYKPGRDGLFNAKKFGPINFSVNNGSTTKPTRRCIPK